MAKLISAVIKLIPTAPAVVDRQQGKAIHGWFLRQIERFDPELSGNLHRQQATKPFTCSTLHGFAPTFDGRQLHLTPGNSGWFRVTTLATALSAVFEEKVLTELADTLEVAGACLKIDGWTLDPQEHPWAGTTSHEELLRRHLLTAGRPRPVTRLSFTTPTSFNSRKRHMPVPLPELAVLGWLDRWNAFADEKLPSELRSYAGQQVVIAGYRLSTTQVRFGSEMTIGCIGTCRYRSLGTDEYWLRLWHTLAAYSFFCGTGHRTTRGMGQTTVIEGAKFEARNR